MDIPGAQFLLDHYVRFAAARDPVRPLAPGDIASARRILLAVTTGMGDAILATPVLEAVRRAAPQADIRLFCRAPWHTLFADDSRLNGVIPYYGKFRQFFSILRQLRGFAPEIVLAPHINDPDVPALLYLSGCRRIVRVPWGTTRYPFLLSNVQHIDEKASMRGWHVIDERLRILTHLDVPVASRSPSLQIDAGLKEQWREQAQDKTGCAEYAVLHLFSADVYRSIPLPLAGEILALLRQTHPGLGWVITGSQQDRDKLATLPGVSAPGVWLSAGDLSLRETAACLAGASAIIAPDTGILHLAAALDRPLLALFAPTMEAATRAQVVGPRTASAPVRVIEVAATCDPCVGRRCPHRPVTCLQAFSGPKIAQAFAELLEDSRSTRDVM